MVGLTLNEVAPERLPDLVVIDCDLPNVADLTEPSGLAEMGLPDSYPEGFRATTAYAVTQPIGVTIHTAGHTSILARSASAVDFSRPIPDWAELAIFTDQAPSPEMIDRLSWKAWL
jgi:hypothetical protein